MEREKVKEIKKALEERIQHKPINCNHSEYVEACGMYCRHRREYMGTKNGQTCKNCSDFIATGEVKEDADILTLINELETENERLKHLNNSMSLGADLHAESYQQEITELDKENQQLKDRIAELENTDYYKEIEKKKEELLCKEYSLIKYEKEIAGKYLKEFAEKLKECAQTNLDHFTGFQKVILTEQIDELLKEYDKWTETKDAYQIGQLNELRKT